MCRDILSGASADQAGTYSVLVTNRASAPGLGLLSSNVLLGILPATAPTASTLSAGDISPDGAALNASVNPMGAQTVAWFDYGLTPAYGRRSPATNLGNASSALEFRQAISGLLSAEHYHYRIVATNHGGIALGVDAAFQTVATMPSPTIKAFGFLAKGRFWLQFDGAAGSSYAVLVSANLVEWTAVGPAAEPTPGHFEFTDADVPGQATRFYRLRSP